MRGESPNYKNIQMGGSWEENSNH